MILLFYDGKKGSLTRSNQILIIQIVKVMLQSFEEINLEASILSRSEGR